MEFYLSNSYSNPNLSKVLFNSIEYQRSNKNEQNKLKKRKGPKKTE